jgi:hypothetical protein
MPKYVKVPIAPGKTISSQWGNEVQNQFDNVVGVNNDDVTEFKAAILATDTRTIEIVRLPDGSINYVNEMDQGNVVIMTTFERVGGSGVIDTVLQEAGGVNVAYHVNRTAGKITSITKEVL